MIGAYHRRKCNNPSLVPIRSGAYEDSRSASSTVLSAPALTKLASILRSHEILAYHIDSHSAPLLLCTPRKASERSDELVSAGVGARRTSGAETIVLDRSRWWTRSSVPELLERLIPIRALQSRVLRAPRGGRREGPWRDGPLPADSLSSFL